MPRVHPEDLYDRLHLLSKLLESSGVIDQMEHRDAYPTILDAMNFVRERIREAEVLRSERDQARARVDYSVKLLMGIHALLYPAPLTIADGRTMVFRPKNYDPHELMQELSDRIRALPDKLEKLASVGPPPIGSRDGISDGYDAFGSIAPRHDELPKEAP